MSPDLSARIADAERAKAALDEFLRPAIMVTNARLLTQLAKLGAKPKSPARDAAIDKISIAIEMIGDIQAEIEHSALDGHVAQAEKAKRDLLSKLNPEQRKWAMW